MQKDEDNNAGVGEGASRELAMRKRSVPQFRTGFSVLDAQLPAYLSGQGRANRQAGYMAIEAHNDLQAINSWLEGLSPNTYLSYRKTAYRFLAWCVVVRRVPFADLKIQDWYAYEEFVASPPEHWVSQSKPAPFGSLGYRFFRGPLSPNSIRHERGVIHGLYAWLVNVRYLQANPLASIARRNSMRVGIGTEQQAEHSAQTVREEREKASARGKALSDKATSTIAAFIEQMPRNGLGYLKRARYRWVFNLLRFTGLRASELISITSSSDYLEVQNVEDQDAGTQVVMHLVGKGGKYRKVPWPKSLYMDFYTYRVCSGLAGELQPGEAIPLLLSTDRKLLSQRIAITSRAKEKANAEISRLALAPAITRQSLYHMLRTLYDETAQWCNDPIVAKELKGKGIHTLRHTFATNLVDVTDIRVAMRLLGHTNMATTSRYSHAEDQELQIAIENSSRPSKR